MTMRAMTMAAGAMPILSLFLAACGSVDEKPEPAPHPTAFKSVRWGDDIKVAQQKLRESGTAYEQVLPRLDERRQYNYTAFIDEDAISQRYAGKPAPSVEGKLRRMFNYRILKISRGAGEMRMYFLERIPRTREYLFEEKMSEDHSMATSELARILIVFDPALPAAEVAERICGECPEFESMDKPYKAMKDDVEIKFIPYAQASDSADIRGPAIVKTSSKAMADYRKAVTEKAMELIDSQLRRSAESKNKSLDF